MKKLNELPGDSRVWIYQCERALAPHEESQLIENLDEFMADWTSHGQQMEAAGEVFYHRFLIIGADEKKALASGCGIDKSVNFVKRMGVEFGVDFFKRTQVVFRSDNHLEDCDLHVFWARRKAGLVNNETIVFDNTIRTVADLKNKWEVPFFKSWHAEMWLK